MCINDTTISDLLSTQNISKVEDHVIVIQVQIDAIQSRIGPNTLIVHEYINTLMDCIYEYNQDGAHYETEEDTRYVDKLEQDYDYYLESHNFNG